MNISITETDRQNAQRIALRSLARFFDISNWESKKNEDLLTELSSLSSKQAIDIMRLLKEYFKAYDSWFEFYEQRRRIEEKTGNEYILKESEKEILGNLIREREDSLNVLQEKFDQLQFQKFNNENFGGVTGTID